MNNIIAIADIINVAIVAAAIDGVIECLGMPSTGEHIVTMCGMQATSHNFSLAPYGSLLERHMFDVLDDKYSLYPSLNWVLYTCWTQIGEIANQAA